MSQSLPDLPLRCAGGCHCGAVRFELTIRELRALDCNCSICTKKGFLHLILPASDFILVQGKEALSTYTFGSHSAKHHFCSACGIHSFYVPRSHPDGIDVNLRCLDLDLIKHMEISPFDGQDWEGHIEEIEGYKEAEPSISG